jgi:hypothetical protein
MREREGEMEVWKSTIEGRLVHWALYTRHW